ncbi:MAG: hypothetical protein ACLRL6_08880 [Clostridium sp.]
MNVKSKVLKIRNLPTDGRKIDQINAKPYLIIAVFLFIGIALLFTRVYLIGIVITLSVSVLPAVCEGCRAD